MKRIIFCFISLIFASQSLAHQDLKKSAVIGALVFDAHQVRLDNNFILNDFCIYEYSTNYFEIFAKLMNTSSKYCKWVNLRYNYFKNGSFITSDYRYIDLETYQSIGILPYHCSLIETIIDKVDFDSISFQINYDIDNKIDKFLCDQILILEESTFTPSFSYYDWTGYVKNESTYNVRYPDIFACFFKNNQMIYITHTYLDVQNDTLRGGETGYIDSFVDIPNNYDYIQYYLSYSINSLDGTGNLCPNLPTFTETKYKGLVNESLEFKIFVADLNADKMSVMIDWGDGSTSPWEGLLISNTTNKFNHIYSSPGNYYINAKAKDIYNAETHWSDSIEIIIDAVIPIELAKFEAKMQNGSVTLDWTTISESNNFGFEIHRKHNDNDWQQIGFVHGNGSTTKETYYSFTDRNIVPGEISYRLKQIDIDGSFKFSETRTIIVLKPHEYMLYQNFPNPFNSHTVISFELPEASNLNIEIYNINSEKVAEIFHGRKEAGIHSLIWDASALPSGTYFIRLKSGNYFQVKKCTLQK